MARLRRDLLTGRLPPGGRLPPERELATRLGTNRNTLREALRILEAEKLVQARQGDGTLVLDWRAVGEITLVPSFLVEETPSEERFEAVITLFQLRERLMEEVIAATAMRASEAELDGIHAALRALAMAPEAAVETVEADVEVYRRIVLASHNLVLIWVFNTFARIFLELGERFPSMWTADTPYLEGLAKLLRELRERRSDRARETLDELFAERRKQLLKRMRAMTRHPEPKRAETRGRRGARP
jgi:DNA-binding FadR family transcriptional regulator